MQLLYPLWCRRDLEVECFSKRNSEATVLVLCKFCVIRVRDTLILLLVDFTALC